MRRVGIIGVGLVTPGGKNLDETWRFLLEEKSSCAPLGGEFQSKANGHRISYWIRQADRLAIMADWAIAQAMARMPEVKVDALCIGSTSASFSEVEQGIPMNPGGLTEKLLKCYKIPAGFQTSQACSSSSHAIALGVDLIRSGMAKVVIAGGVDELTDCVVQAFDSCRILADKCMPFDKNRRGLVLGEAAAFVLLATPDLIPNIAPPLAYITGVGLTCDAHDSVAPSEEGIKRAIAQAMIDARDRRIDFVIAHGTGTKLNDVTEANSILPLAGEIFGPCPVVSSYKGSLGHPQGASGAVAVALAVQALRTQTIFPTVGLTEFDPEIKVRLTSHMAYHKVDKVMCLAYGSWGTNAAIIVSGRENANQNPSYSYSDSRRCGTSRPERDAIPEGFDVGVHEGYPGVRQPVPVA